MDDEAILASVDTEPDAFAGFYRRHSGRLLDYLEARMEDLRQAGDLCAETFAEALCRAHRFDPEREDAAAWLDGISRRLVARAERRGIVDDSCRRRLGMAPLDLPGAGRERFLRDLEEELVEAARFRAARRRRPRLPAGALRTALAGVAALALVAAVAALAAGRGGDDRAVGARHATASPSDTTALLPMLEPRACARGTLPEEPALATMPDIGLLDRPQRGSDTLGLTASTTSMPIRTFDPAEIRRAGEGRLRTRLHVVASLGVSADGRCGSDDGPGVCLIARGRAFRCFPIAEVRAGRAFARTPDGPIVGIVPDGIDRVTLTAARRTAAVRVVDNVYETDLPVPAGRPVMVELPQLSASGCPRKLDPELLARVAALGAEPRGSDQLPPAARSVLSYWQLDQVVEERSRYWGFDGGVDFWVVPAVPLGRERCEPATAACVVAVTRRGRADAECVLREERRRDAWRLTPLLRGHAAIYGIVPDGVTGLRVSIGGDSAEVAARGNVVGGVLPFGYRAGARVAYVRGRTPSPRPEAGDAAHAVAGG